MQRYFAQISFKGTKYHGWQIQPGAVTVQEIIERAVSTVTREVITVTGAGRTDAGVHASFFVLHFDSDNENIDTVNLKYRLNSLLPSDIFVSRIWKVSSEAHARFSALSRSYKYFITKEKDPFRIETSYYYSRKLEIDKMNDASSLLMNYNDFTSFSRLHTDVKTNLCRIYRAGWKEEDNLLIFTIKADRFLRNMVRAIVGTMLDVGRGKISVDEFRSIIEIKNRSAAGSSAPACGLFLTGIDYPEDIENFTGK